MNNYELGLFREIMEKGIYISHNEHTDKQLYNLQLTGYIELYLLNTGKIVGKRIFNKKNIALANQLNIKVIK